MMTSSNETFFSLLAICVGNSRVTGEFPAPRPVTRSFDVFLYLRLNKRLSKQWWGWWFVMPLCPLWRHCNVKLRKPYIVLVYLMWPDYPVVPPSLSVNKALPISISIGVQGSQWYARIPHWMVISGQVLWLPYPLNCTYMPNAMIWVEFWWEGQIVFLICPLALGSGKLSKVW